MSMTPMSLTHPVLDRWRACLDTLDEPHGMSFIANDILVSCIQDAIAAAVEAERVATKKVLEDLYEVGPLDRSDATAAWVQAWGSGILDAADIIGGRIAIEARSGEGERG